MARSDRRRLLVTGIAAIALSGCAPPRLDADWTETETLVTARETHGSYLLVARDMMVRGEYDLALRAYTRAIGEDGLSGPIVGGIGAANAQLDRVNQAHRYLERGTRIAPQSVSIWNNLGVVLWQAGDQETAQAAFRVAKEVAEPSDAVVAANIGITGGTPKATKPQSSNLVLQHSSDLFLIVEAPVPDETDVPTEPD